MNTTRGLRNIRRSTARSATMKAVLIAFALGAACYAQVPGPTTPLMERRNDEAAVDIDRFIGSPQNSPVHLTHGTMLYRTMLQGGDPYKVGLAGAVLEYHKDLSLATLLGKSETILATLPDEYLFYVKSGEGRLDDGKSSWDLSPGIAVLAPPSAPHRFTTTTEKPLEMMMLRLAAAGTPGRELIVRDTRALPFCEENAHWNNFSKCVFGTADGLAQGERMYLVMLPPWASSAPHPHVPGVEEVWTRLTPGPGVTMIGSELREIGENTAYMIPPTGTIVHSNLNLSRDTPQWWLYIARFGPSPAGSAPPVNASSVPPTGGTPAFVPNGSRGGTAASGRNPNLSREVKGATVPGKPLR